MIALISSFGNLLSELSLATRLVLNHIRYDLNRGSPFGKTKGVETYTIRAMLSWFAFMELT